MAPRFFPFVQVEMPLRLGVPDGRWMVRAPDSQEVERVVAVASAQAPRAGRLHAGRAQAPSPADAQPTAVPITRVTLIAAQPLADRDAAEAWLSRLDAESEIDSAFASLDRLLAAHRVAAADPYAHEVSPEQALAIRAGFGEGEQVADGRWMQARELRLPEPHLSRRRRRAAILHSHERLSSLLASERGALLCEELALRARLDLDHGRLALAAGELERALSLAVVELEGEPGTHQRRMELHELLRSVHETAERLLPSSAGPSSPSAQDAEIVSYALGRLEAALRSRASALTWR